MLETSLIQFETTGNAQEPVIVWAHGWGQNRASFRALASSFEGAGRHYLIDFPGFGAAAPPPEGWGTAEYADDAATFIKKCAPGKIIWIGHSFGCRVGLQLAARHPDLMAGLFLVAAAGLRRRRPLLKRLYLQARIRLFKGLKKLIPIGLSEGWLMRTFSSPDYAKAGPMRGVLVKVVNEDLSDIARHIVCPVTLVYGSEDRETPPEIGRRLAALIEHAEMIQLDGQDHYSILAGGRHQTARLLKNFLEKIRDSHG